MPIKSPLDKNGGPERTPASKVALDLRLQYVLTPRGSRRRTSGGNASSISET
jgi:hypothetical protein